MRLLGFEWRRVSSPGRSAREEQRDVVVARDAIAALRHHAITHAAVTLADGTVIEIAAPSAIPANPIGAPS